MSVVVSTVLLLLLSAYAFGFGRRRVRLLAARAGQPLQALPFYYGLYAVFWCIGPAALIAAGSLFAAPSVLRALTLLVVPPELATLDPALLYDDIRALAAGATVTHSAPALHRAAAFYSTLRESGLLSLVVLILAAAGGGLLFARRVLHPVLQVRQKVERVILWGLMACSGLAVLVTIGIVLSLVVETARFFAVVPPHEFFFGLEWSPQTALRADQVGSSSRFGAVPVFAGTLLISAIAMLVAAPIGIFSAIYTAEYASPRCRAIVKPLMEVLAGIPTVVYGFFAILTIAPFLRQLGQALGLDVASESALTAGLVMGVMIVPFVSSLSDDMIAAVPQSLREGALGLGSTPSEAIRRVVLTAAMPGIVGSLLLAVSRAIGETMIVVMAAGLAANLTGNPFHAVTTVTVQIVTLLVGDQEFDSLKTLAAFALGLVLFAITLFLNVVALIVVRRYRERYE